MATTVEKISGVSSSDSPNEGETRRSKEADVLDCHHSARMTGKSKGKARTRKGRPLHNDAGHKQMLSNTERQDENFRTDIGMELSHVIDSMIEMNGQPYPYTTSTEATQVENGIRLFSNSAKNISLEETQVATPIARKRRVESSSSDSSEDARLASAAVDHSFLFKDVTMLGMCKQNSTNPHQEKSTKGKKLKKKRKKKQE